MKKERTYLAIDADLKAILKVIQEKEGHATLNDFIISVLEDYAINSNVKFKFEDRISQLIKSEISKLNNTNIEILKVIKQIIDLEE